jgi:hypothetical protein
MLRVPLNPASSSVFALWYRKQPKALQMILVLLAGLLVPVLAMGAAILLVELIGWAESSSEPPLRIWLLGDFPAEGR